MRALRASDQIGGVYLTVYLKNSSAVYFQILRTVCRLPKNATFSSLVYRDGESVYIFETCLNPRSYWLKPKILCENL